MGFRVWGLGFRVHGLRGLCISGGLASLKQEAQAPKAKKDSQITRHAEVLKSGQRPSRVQGLGFRNAEPLALLPESQTPGALSPGNPSEPPPPP